ncbi:hypothetical protein [Dyella sp. GSA-30]|uniref:hypothetical protein n=1 Tax=Dyella sp. GSA-30 TaxID=2994496 RepID=UPI002492C85A|nr:hypothetical protein [Dyella sp. GSA-30]
MEIKNFIVQLAIFIPLYLLGILSTVQSADPTLGSSINQKYFNSERDEAIIVNGFFIVLVSALSMFHNKHLEVGVTLWTLALAVALLEILFLFKNQLDKRWKWINRALLWLTLLIEPATWLIKAST